VHHALPDSGNLSSRVGRRNQSGLPATGEGLPPGRGSDGEKGILWE